MKRKRNPDILNIAVIAGVGVGLYLLAKELTGDDGLLSGIGTPNSLRSGFQFGDSHWSNLDQDNQMSITWNVWHKGAAGRYWAGAALVANRIFQLFGGNELTTAEQYFDVGDDPDGKWYSVDATVRFPTRPRGAFGQPLLGDMILYVANASNTRLATQYERLAFTA